MLRKISNFPTPTLRNTSAFTLVELLLVIGILAVLSTTAVLVLNPAQLIAQGRDAKRVNDLHLLDQALSVYQTQGGTSFGTLQRVYISLPDSSATCATYTSLPILPSPWIYQCATAANYRRVDGSGWLPVNLSSTNTLTASVLPIDPINTDTANSYYTYIPGSWNLTAPMESSKYLRTTSLSDGGLDPSRLEAGSDKSLWTTASGLVGYWPLDEGSGTSASDLSGNNNTGTLTNGPTWTASGKIGGATVFDGIDDRINIPNTIGLNSNHGPSALSFWFYSTDISGTRTLFADNCGVEWGINTVAGVLQGRIYNSLNGPTIQTNNWYHAALTHALPTGTTNTEVKLYLNGSLQASTTWTLGAENGYPDYPFNIGSDGCNTTPSYTSFFKGNIDDLRLYKRALSASEISAIYNAAR